jgi:hypothetical protein
MHSFVAQGIELINIERIIEIVNAKTLVEKFL